MFPEVPKLTTASDMHPTPFHFRDRQMHEVDIVLERNDGAVAGIEAKAAATAGARDFAGLGTLAEACGRRFAYGAVLHDRARFVPFGDRPGAVPPSSLWA